jgi:multimeric flavodoxin WrbA
MKVLGVSGSPIKNSNTDRALKAVLDATGCETEFVKLTDYRVEPCRACLGCVKSNQCVIQDGCPTSWLHGTVYSFAWSTTLYELKGS